MRLPVPSHRSRHVLWRFAASLLVTACADRTEREQPYGHFEPDPPPVDDRDVVVSAVPPPPIFGGTLTVIPESDVAVVSDPDRDLVYIVDLHAFALTQTITLPAGAWPWRSVADADGRVHVVLRGSGRVIAIDVADGTLVLDRAVCRDPRGLDVRDDDGAVIVACADGRLRVLPADGGPAQTLTTLDADLRDVMVQPDGSIEVSRFRSATVLALDPQGASTGEIQPSGWYAQTGGEDMDEMLPSTAWRTVATEDGWVMVHQVASDRTLGEPEDEEQPAYGGRGSSCSAIVQSGVSMYSRTAGRSSTGPLTGVVLPVDVAMSPNGRWAGVASAASVPGGGHLQAALVALEDFADDTEPRCRAPIDIELPDDPQAIAVAFDATARLLIQTREPAALYRLDNYELDRIDELSLAETSRFDSGHESFHEDPGTALTCASCHPEGGDDGHVWRFEGLGRRHTPALDVGLRGTAPFHWSGELPDFAALVDDVFVRRMGATMPSRERTAALEEWLYTISHARIVVLDDAAERGAAAWAALECSACHTGATLTNNSFATIGTGEPLQVPPLHAVGLHPPYMHDGHAPTLEVAVREMIEATAPAPALVSEEQLADLVAYLHVL